MTHLLDAIFKNRKHTNGDESCACAARFLPDGDNFVADSVVVVAN